MAPNVDYLSESYGLLYGPPDLRATSTSPMNKCVSKMLIFEVSEKKEVRVPNVALIDQKSFLRLIKLLMEIQFLN